jgi:hypothetical protein
MDPKDPKQSDRLKRVDAQQDPKQSDRLKRVDEGSLKSSGSDRLKRVDEGSLKSSGSDRLKRVEEGDLKRAGSGRLKRVEGEGSVEHERSSMARELIRILAKVLKAMRLYDTSHGQLTTGRDELAGVLKTYIKLYGVLRIEVARDTFKLENDRLYDEPSRDANIALRLYVGGLRELTFFESPTPEDVEKLLAIVGSRSEEKDVAVMLAEASFKTIDYLCLDELAEGWNQPDTLSKEAVQKIVEMNKHADELIEVLSRRRRFEGADEFEVSDTGEELEKVDELETDSGGDDDDEDEDLFAIPEKDLAELRDEAKASGMDEIQLRLLDIVLDGLALEPEALGAPNGTWFLEEIPHFALRRGDLRLLGKILDRYEREAATDSPVGVVLSRVSETFATSEAFERLIALATSGAAGGPPALIQVLKLLGGSRGVEVAVPALLKAQTQELREALQRYLTERFTENPAPIRRLAEPTVPAELARWTLFTASKKLRGQSVELLLDMGMTHPDKQVKEYASFLTRTMTAKGRLRAFQDALRSEDVAERIRAAQLLGRERDPEGLEHLKAAVQDASFLSRTVEEKRAFLEAIAQIGGNQARGILTEQTKRKTSIFRLRAGGEVREEAERLLKKIENEPPKESAT